ncbi:hypothetical protein GCM10017778_72010 [Streptomyces vinaceus]|nr:hypothetical protein GCM10017778_72010 [Streptomyces vinaceus]
MIFFSTVPSVSVPWLRHATWSPLDSFCPPDSFFALATVMSFHGRTRLRAHPIHQPAVIGRAAHLLPPPAAFVSSTPSPSELPPYSKSVASIERRGRSRMRLVRAGYAVADPARMGQLGPGRRG